MHHPRHILLLLTLITISHCCLAQSGVFIPPNSDIMVFKKDTVSIFGDVQNAGRLGSMKGAMIYFYGQHWRNEQNALIPDEYYYNDTLHPDGGTFNFSSHNGPQFLFGGYNAGTKSGASFPRLQLANPDGLYLEDLSDTKIRYLLQFDSGHVFLNGWNLVVGHGSPGNIGGYSHHRFVVTGTAPGGGYLFREQLNSAEGDVAFPVGTAPGSYSPLTIRHNETAPADFHARVFDSVYTSAISGPALIPDKVLKTWNIGGQHPEGSVFIRLQHERQAEDTLFSYHRDSSYVSRFQPTGWDTLPPGGITNPGTITTGTPQPQSYLNTRSFPDGIGSNLYLSKSAVPFPGESRSLVDLLFFAYRKDIRWVQTYWYTRREVNVQHFELQRRRELEDTFYTVQTVLPTVTDGNSIFAQYYDAEDDNFHDNWTYYRVKTLARDGRIFYSEVKKVPWFYRISVYPNPNAGIFRIDLFGVDKIIRMEMYDVAGRLKKTQLLSSQSNLINCNLSSGTYLLVFYDTANNDQRIGAQQIIILK